MESSILNARTCINNSPLIITYHNCSYIPYEEYQALILDIIISSIEENEDSEIDNTNYNISITDETNKPDESEEVDLLCNNPIYESKEIDQCCDNPIYETMKNDPAYETLESVACNYEEAAKSMRALTPQRNDDTYAYLTSST